MPLYRTNFERFNFSITPPLAQRADVLLKTDVPFDSDNMDEFEEALWAALWAQNPHWEKSDAPLGLASGWSSVIGGHKIELVPDNATLSLAWHITQDGWLKADGKTMTVEPDEAGRFSADQVIELQSQYPGERYSMVQGKLYSEVYTLEGASPKDCVLQLHYDEFVIWGFGPRADAGLQEVSKLQQGSSPFVLKFKLPKPTKYRQDPQEYERKKCWAWRFIYNGMGLGVPWCVAEDKASAILAARAKAVEHMRSTGHRHTAQILAVTHNLDLVDSSTKECAPVATI